MPVLVCQNARIKRCRLFPVEEHEVLRGRQASKDRYFYGFKIHLVVTRTGEPIEFFISKGAMNDLEGLRRLDLDLPKGSLLFADKAYISHNSGQLNRRDYSANLAISTKLIIQQKGEAIENRNIRIQDIADALGIHKSTVSKAMTGKGTVSPKLRLKITSYAEQVGYEPDPFAQGLANRGKSNTTFLCSGVLDVGRVTEKLILIQQVLSSRGLEVPIYTAAKASDNTIESQNAIFRQLRRLRPQIIICTALQFVEGVLSELEAYQAEGGIVINYDIPIDLECDQVLFDREQNSYLATRHLLECGHRHLGLVVSKRTSIISHSANLTQNARIRGFERALGEFGLSLEENFLFEEQMLERGGSNLAKQFLASKHRPTGLCISNDYMALAFMVEVMAAGVRVPEDVSLVGMNDQLVASYCPVPLTSLSNPSDEIAQAVIEKTIARLDGYTGPPEKQFVEGKLIERASVAVI